MDKRTVLAVALSLVVILAYQFFLLPKQPPRPPQPSQQAAPVAPPVVSPAPPAAPPVPTVSSAEQAARVALQDSTPARDIVVESDLLRVVLDTRGAVAKSWLLKSYRDGEGNPVELVPVVPAGTAGPLSAVFADPARTASFAGGIWLYDGANVTLGQGTPEATLRLTRTDETGLLVTKRLTFRRDSYLVDVAVEATTTDGVRRPQPIGIQWGPGIGREPASRSSYQGPLHLRGEKLSQGMPKEDGGSLALPSGFAWAGLTNHYFLAAFVPGESTGEAVITRVDKTNHRLAVMPRAETVPSGASSLIEAQLFVGPKSIDVLKSYGHKLDSAIDFGWVGWLGRKLLGLLKFFHGFIGSWGVAIILLTLMVKALLFPVTFNMYRSMRRMQSFQPQVTALRKKYKDDPQTLNQEVMALYRDNKINPMGGCLPMLIQIPIFFALYRVLSVAIELRGASFLHIRDLAAAETSLGEVLHGLASFFPAGLLPLKVMVILMGVTMLIQQKLSPSMADPKQAKMMMFLPIIFTAMFWNFTSGLVVYFLFSNLLSIGEQMLIRRWSGDGAAATGVAKKHA
jgi:YidC/Oxa1 family membrane protein insertase